MRSRGLLSGPPPESVAIVAPPQSVRQHSHTRVTRANSFGVSDSVRGRRMRHHRQLSGRVRFGAQAAQLLFTDDWLTSPVSLLKVNVTVPPAFPDALLTLHVTVVPTFTKMFCGQLTVALGAPFWARDFSSVLSTLEPGICTEPDTTAYVKWLRLGSVTFTSPVASFDHVTLHLKVAPASDFTSFGHLTLVTSAPVDESCF